MFRPRKLPSIHCGQEGKSGCRIPGPVLECPATAEVFVASCVIGNTKTNSGTQRPVAEHDLRAGSRDCRLVSRGHPQPLATSTRLGDCCRQHTKVKVRSHECRPERPFTPLIGATLRPPWRPQSATSRFSAPLAASGAARWRWLLLRETDFGCWGSLPIRI